MVAGTMALSLAQWGKLGPSWRRNLCSPIYMISAGAPPAGEGILRQGLSLEAMVAWANKETELNHTSPCLALKDGWLARDG